MQINSSGLGVVTIHEVRLSACRSKHLLYESDRSIYM